MATEDNAASSSAVDMDADPAPARSRTVVIGTRESALAMYQARYVQDALQKLHSDVEIKIEGMTTVGDKILNTPLSTFSSKGVFTKELDEALLQHKVDLAVHCVKDLPTILPDGLAMCAILQRWDTEDALILHPKHKGLTLETLPKGAIIGTSALRRTAILARKFPHLVCKDVRGNLNTRLKKLDEGQYDALILAAIGLKRLGMADRISQLFDMNEYGYAVGQGALAIVCRAGDEEMARLCEPLEHPFSKWQCLTERGLLRTLEGGCKVPIAVSSRLSAAMILANTNSTTTTSALDGPDDLKHHSVYRMQHQVLLELTASVVSLDGKDFCRITNFVHQTVYVPYQVNSKPINHLSESTPTPLANSTIEIVSEKVLAERHKQALEAYRIQSKTLKQSQPTAVQMEAQEALVARMLHPERFVRADSNGSVSTAPLPGEAVPAPSPTSEIADVPQPVVTATVPTTAPAATTDEVKANVSPVARVHNDDDEVLSPVENQQESQPQPKKRTHDQTLEEEDDEKTASDTELDDAPAREADDKAKKPKQTQMERSLDATSIRLGCSVARALLDNGAREILDKIRVSTDHPMNGDE